MCCHTGIGNRVCMLWKSLCSLDSCINCFQPSSNRQGQEHRRWKTGGTRFSTSYTQQGGTMKYTYTGCISSTQWFRTQLWCLNPTCYNCLRNRHFSHEQMLSTWAQRVQCSEMLLLVAANTALEQTHCSLQKLPAPLQFICLPNSSKNNCNDSVS